MMSNALKNEFLSLYNKFKQEDSLKSNRLDRWRNLEPESAEFITLLMKFKQCRNILEIGTSNGFSTLWFAETVKQIGANFISIEIDENRTNEARRNLQKFNLSEYVELKTIDAQKFLEQIETNYDLIFLDAERKYYTNYWIYLKQLLSNKGNLLVVDNVISHADDVIDFIQLIQEDNFTISIVPVGAGLLLVTA